MQMVAEVLCSQGAGKDEQSDRIKTQSSIH